MGGPKPPARRLDGRGARTDGMPSSTTKPKQPAQRRSGKPANLKVDVKNLEPSCPHPISTSPIEKHIVNPQAPKGSRARSASSFLQPDQFIAELKVKTGAGNRSEVASSVTSPGSARSTRSTGGATSASVRSSKEPRNGAPAREPPSLPVRKSPKPRPSNRTQPVSQGAAETTATKRERSVSRGAGSSVQRSPTSTGLESLSEPANSVPTLELSYEGKPAPAPAHLRARTGHTTNSTPPQPSDGEALLGKFATAELQKSPSQGSGRFSKGASAGLLKLQSTSARLGRSCSPAKMREKLVRSVSSRKESSSREDGDSRAVHSFHAGTSTRPHSQSRPAHSQPIKSSDAKSMNDVEGDAGKPAGRLRRMVQWGASKTGLEVLKSLERKLGKKSSKVSSGSKMGGGRAEQMEATKIDAEREIREVTDRSEKIDDAIFDDGNCSARSSVSSVSTTYSDVSSKSHSYKHSHHKKNAKSEVVKSRLWLLRVHHKLQGRQSKESEEDSIYDAVQGATLHSTADATTFNDEDKKRSPGSARFNLEKNAIAKLVAKHKRNSTWDAGKLSPNDHLFSPKHPRLPKSDAHILLAPPKKLTVNTGDTEFQQRRGNPSSLNTQSGLDSSSSPRTVSAPEHQVAKPGGPASRPNSRTTTPARTRRGQAVALPALPSSGAFLQAAALMLASPERAESERSPKRSVQGLVSPARSELHSPPISPGALPTSSKSSFRDFRGFNSPLPLPVRVGRIVGSELCPPSPIYPASQSPGRFASPTRAGILRSTPTSPGLYALPPSWTGMQSPTRHHGVSSSSPGANAEGAGFQNSTFAGLDAATSRASSTGEGSNGEEIFVLANSSFDSTSSSNSSLVLSNTMKPPDAHQEGTRMRSRSPSPVGRNGVTGPKADEFGSSVSDERERSDKQKTGSGDALSLRVSPRSRAVSFEQIVAGRGRSPPTDNTLMKFFFKCREIELLNKFLALQKKRFLESFNTESKKCFHMILSESGRGLSSMISTLCMAWLLENKMASALVKWHPIPVMNMSREEMWQHRDAAWLFHVCGVEANAVLFLDEITSSNGTVVAGRVKRAVAGQDILVTKDEVASSCTIVSEKFRQEAPKLLQARYMKTLLLAGILVDTKNLSTGSPRDKQQATILLVGAGSLGRNGFYKHLVSILDEDYVTTFIKEIYGDSNALTGENPVPKRQGVERPKSFSTSSQSHEKAEGAPPSRPVPLRPPPLEIPAAPSEVSPSISPTPPVPLQKPITQLSRKSEVEKKLSRKSEVEAKRSRKSEVEASRRSRKSMSEVENGDSGKVSSNKTEGISQNSKISFGLRRFRNRSSAQ